MKKIHCFGAVVVDMLNGPIPAYPVPRLKTQVTAKWIRIMPGGGAANAPSALARMGLAISTFSKVGDDFYGEFIRRELQQAGGGRLRHLCVGARHHRLYLRGNPSGRRPDIHPHAGRKRHLVPRRCEPRFGAGVRLPALPRSVGLAGNGRGARRDLAGGGAKAGCRNVPR